MMALVDSHCHLDFPEFDENREALFEQCQAAGITDFVVPGVSFDTWPRLQMLAETFPQCHVAYGLHPYFIEQHQTQDLDVLRKYLQSANVIAVGEIGLDFYKSDLPREKQLTFFRAQLQIAQEFQLPVILHVRKAHDEVLKLLKQFKLQGGTAHAFNGSLQQAKQYIAMGFKLGFGGALLNPNARHLHELVELLPLEAIVLETDSPDMKPADEPGAFNTPLTLIRVLRRIAEIRSTVAELIIKQTTKNINAVFKLGSV